MIVPATEGYLFRFDGSFQGVAGAGIGVTLGYHSSGTSIASFSLPTKTKDAQRTEMLGPTFAALIASTFNGKHFYVEGDS